MAKSDTDSGVAIKTVVILLRLVVGAAFVFSGFTKGIDPWGTVYKLEEYLRLWGFDGYTSLITFCAFAIAIAESIIGISLLLGIYRRVSVWVATLAMAILLPLTIYTAVTGAVYDCGCFGDAIHLQPWATVWKNVVLFACIVALVVLNRRAKGLFPFAAQWIVVTLTGIYILALALAGYYYQPLIDWRPYPVGTSLVSDNGIDDTDDDMLFIYQKDGVRSQFSLDSLPDEGEGWEFVERIVVSNHQSSVAEESASLGLADGVILAEGRQLLLTFPDLPAVSIKYTYLINEIVDRCRDAGVEVTGLTSASDAQVDEWRDLSMASYQIIRISDTQLKMLARGNPAVVTLEDSRIIDKRSLSSISMAEVSNGRVLDNYETVQDIGLWPVYMTAAYLAALLLLWAFGFLVIRL